MSPSGKWLGLQGRTIDSGATLYETSTWKMRTETGKIYPGDSDLAIEERGTLSIRHADGSLSVLAGIRPYWDRCCSYIGSSLLAVLSNELDAVVVFNSKGTELYRIAVSDRSHTHVIATCCGTDRFAITESSYSFWNKLTNLMDVAHNRPFDVERVRIFAASTGHELSEVEFDPRVKLVPLLYRPEAICSPDSVEVRSASGLFPDRSKRERDLNRYDKLICDMFSRPTRRGFLQQTAAMTALGLPAAAQTRRKISPNDKIRLAAVGLGIMGNKDCVTALKIPGVELVAVCDLYTGRLDAAKENYGQDVAVTKDYRALLERSDIDAVIVATCDKWHNKIATDALEKGKAVYCEKPMVRQISEGLGVIDTAKKTGGIMQVGSQWVSSVVFQKAREQFRAGAIGQLNCIEASYDRQSALGAWEYTIPTDASAATVDWDRYIAGSPHIPYDEKKFFWWRNYREFGTGVAGDLFVHLISGVHFVTGSKGPVRVFSSGEIAYWKDGRNVPDVMTAVMDYPETPEHPKFQITLRVDFASGAGEKAVTRFVGSEGIMEMSFRNFSVIPHAMSKAPGIGGWDSLDTYPKAMQAELLKRYNDKYPAADREAAARAGVSYQAPDSYDEHVDHFTNFFDTMRGTAKLNEDPVFAFRAAAPCIACNDSYFQKKIIYWDPENMRLTS